VNACSGCFEVDGGVRLDSLCRSGFIAAMGVSPSRFKVIEDSDIEISALIGASEGIRRTKHQ